MAAHLVLGIFNNEGTRNDGWRFDRDGPCDGRDRQEDGGHV